MIPRHLAHHKYIHVVVKTLKKKLFDMILGRFFTMCVCNQ